MIHQVYFKPEQRGILEPQFKPYSNEGMLTNYYENEIIARLIKEESDPDEYFGVLSWSLRGKIERMKQYPHPFKNISTESYSFNWLLSEIEKNEDVIFLMEHEKHDPVVAAARIHPNFLDNWYALLRRLKLPSPPMDIILTWEKVIYCNFFIAKHKVYKAYVDELLDPAMKIMETMPELNEDARYPMGPGYTYHSFLCERLFSYWYNFIYKKNGIKI